MPGPRILPPDHELREMVDSGLSQSQIAQKVWETTGVRVSRSAVSVALVRAGLTGERKRRVLTPQGVREDHAGQYVARMLRAESRLREGLPLRSDEARRLEKWKARLTAQGLVVAYHRCEDESCEYQGWSYVPARPGVDDLIRRDEVA